jgi:retron-type reverse transcriptase
MIEGDIKGFFDNVDHHIMEKLLIKYANPDQMMINLYWKMVRAGYVENATERRNTLTGVTQGGIISTLLANLYLTPFDEYMDELSSE